MPFHVPTPTELGLRVRKILSSLSKHQNWLKRQAAKEPKDPAAILERKKMLKEKRLERNKAKESDMSKKAKNGKKSSYHYLHLDFQRALLSFGVERTEDGGFDWNMFKTIAELTRKTDEAMQGYLEKLIDLSNRTIEFHSKLVREGDETGSLLTNPNYPVGEEQEILTIDRARKVIRRIELFDRLRLNVLKMPDVIYF